jgi:hypothetical protein
MSEMLSGEWLGPPCIRLEVSAWASKSLEADMDANQRLYDRAVKAKEIVLHNAVKATLAGHAFIALLDTRATKHKSKWRDNSWS